MEVSFRGAYKQLEHLRANAAEIASEFGLGFALEPKLDARLRDRLRDEPNFRRLVLSGIEYTLRGNTICSEHPDPDEFDAVQLNHFFYQGGGISPCVFWNRTTDKIDFRLYDLIKSIEAEHKVRILEVTCDTWADILKPFEGFFLCVPRELVDDPQVLTKFIKQISEDQIHGEISVESKKMRRGRQPSAAKREYFRRYPEEKPSDISFDAIAAELAETGFPINSRTLQNYERERKNEESNNS